MPSRWFVAVPVVLAVAVNTMYTFNLRGPRLWLSPVPTADLGIDLTGKHAIVTGANTGIGLEMAVGLAAAGADTVLACRSPAKAEWAVREVQTRAAALHGAGGCAAAKPGRVRALLLDLASLSSVRSFAKQAAADMPRVDLLINNAAVISNNREKTAEGLPEVMGVNAVGPWMLTRLLLPQIPAGGRVVFVASKAHSMGQTDFANLLMEGVDATDDQPGPRMGVYGNSKLANILHTREFQRRDKRGILFVSDHPGIIATELHRSDEGLAKHLVKVFKALIALTPWQGAQNTLVLATSPNITIDAHGGAYFEWLEPTGIVFNRKQMDVTEQEAQGLFWDMACAAVGEPASCSDVVEPPLPPKVEQEQILK